jgi:hypothetical protein
MAFVSLGTLVQGVKTIEINDVIFQVYIIIIKSGDIFFPISIKILKM